jgi:hypothetical protein
MRGFLACAKERCVTATVVLEADVLEEKLAAGQLFCPGCDGPLSPWGFAREREVRMLRGRAVCGRGRGRCAPCATTHVLLPAWSVPRRRDGAAVIGRALVLKTRGAGHRTIARRLERPPGTVRGWLRAAARQADALRLCGVRWTVGLGEQLGRPRLPDSPLQGAVDALGRAVVAWRQRFYDPRVSPWELMTMITGGGLLRGRPRDPPGY